MLFVTGSGVSEVSKAANVLANWDDHGLQGRRYIIEEQQSCVDTDGGVNTAAKGEVIVSTKDKEMIYIDYCGVGIDWFVLYEEQV